MFKCFKSFFLKKKNKHARSNNTQYLLKLLIDKYLALKNRLSSNVPNNRKTKNFVKFLLSLGFYFHVAHFAAIPQHQPYPKTDGNVIVIEIYYINLLHRFTLCALQRTNGRLRQQTQKSSWY